MTRVWGYTHILGKKSVCLVKFPPRESMILLSNKISYVINNEGRPHQSLGCLSQKHYRLKQAALLA